MRFLFLILLFVSQNTWAQKKLTAQVFQTNVRPILSGIISDFYQMISLFPDYPKEMVSLALQFNQLDSDQIALRSYCQNKMNKNCLVAIDALRKKLIPIENTSLKLLSHDQMTSSLYLNSIIGYRMINEFHNDLYAFKGSLDNHSFLYRANIKERSSTFDFVKKLDELHALISLAVVEFIPFNYKSDFRGFFSNFVHPIESQLYKQSNYEFFNQNLNSLNFSVNLLNQNLTKRNKKTPEGMAPFLSVIHNRWNSILRYYF
jgi:hypothetical protein